MKIHNVFHASLFKLYKVREGIDPKDDVPDSIIIDGAEEFEIEAIIGKRNKVVSTKKTKHGVHRKTRVEYLVRWKGYGPHHNQWLPEDRLTQHASELLSEYNSRNP